MPRDTSARSIPARVIPPALLVVMVAGGCRSPFMISERDFAGTPDERIRTLRPLDVSEFQRPTADDEEPASVLERPVSPFEGKDTVEVSIESIRAEAIANNLDIRVAQLDPGIAQQTVDEEAAAFDTVFRIDGQYSETDTPTSSTLNDAQANQQFVQPSLVKPLLTGGSIDVSLPFSRVSTNNTFTTLNPAYETDLVVRLTQPLLRGGGRRAATAPLRLAGLSRAVTQVRTRGAIAATLSGVDRSYWELWARRKQLELRIEEFDVARSVLDQARRLVDAGAAAEIEVIRAESSVSDLISQILTAEQLVLRSQRELKRAMNVEGLKTIDETVLLPTTDPSPVPLELDVNGLLGVAMETRPELLELELELLADETRIELAENGRLPQLDLNASYRRNGLGEDTGDAFDQMVDREFEDYTLGLVASIPLGNEAADARLRRATMQRMSRILSKAAREQTIEQEVLDAVDRIRSDWQRIIAGRQSVALNARTLAAEQRQFEAGLSTSIDVLEAAGRLATARGEEIRAIADYELAQIALAESTGTLLGRAAIRFDTDGASGSVSMRGTGLPAN